MAGTRHPERSVVRRIGFMSLSLGFDPRRFKNSVLSLPYFLRTYRRFKVMSANTRTHLSPILGEHRGQAGSVGDDYFAIDLWAARQVMKVRPERHLDVGSRLDGFVAHVLTFAEVDVVDIRPLSTSVKGLTFVRADGRVLEEIPDGEYDLVSSLHAIEHFGLGRYGDEIDPEGHLKAVDAFMRVLKPGGHLLLAFPAGNDEVLFNAQRLLNCQQILRRTEARLIEVVKTDGLGGVMPLDPISSTDRGCIGLLLVK